MDAEREAVLPSSAVKVEEGDEDAYWTLLRAAQAEEYLRDVVYGGMEGYAYVRSVGQFLAPSRFAPDDEAKYKDVDGDVKIESLDTERAFPLGTTLTRFVGQLVLDPLTDALLREAFPALASSPSSYTPPSHSRPTLVEDQLHLSLNILPSVYKTLLQVRAEEEEKIDMGALIRNSDELYESESVLNGIRAMVRSSSSSGNGQDVTMDGAAHETMDELVEALRHVSSVIGTLSSRHRAGARVVKKEEDEDVDMDEQEEENEEFRNLRLNLLGLAKRAPIDMIAHFPKELVPENVRHLIG